MEPQDTRYNEGARRHLGIAAVGVLVVAVVAMACHPWGKHVDGVHTAGDVENACVQMQTSQISFAETRDAINSTLSDSRGWSSRETVSFDLNPVECDNLSAGELVEQEIEYHIYYESPPPACGGHPFNACIVPDPETEEPWYSHLHYDKVRVFLWAPLGLGSFLTNHETGHAVGLADPTPSQQPNKDAETCQIPLDTNGDTIQDIIAPVISIMHNAPRCPAILPVSWPTGQDLYSFDVNVAQDQ